MGFKEKIVAACFAVAWTACAYAQQAQQEQQTLVLKFHTHVPGSSVQWQTMLKPWIERIEGQSKGRIKFERFTDMSFGGKPSELYEQVSNGTVDVVWTQTGLLAGKFNRTEVFELPFMMTTAPAVSRALWEYVETYAADEFKDVHLLGLNVQGEGVLHTRQNAMREISDFKDLKLQATPRLLSRFVEMLGAKSVELPASDVAQGLRDLSIDGFLGTWDSAFAFKSERFIQRHTVFGPDTGALFTRAYVMAMNTSRYESLPADLKAIIDANAGLELSGELGRLAQAIADEQRKKSLADTDPASLITLDGVSAQAFRKASIKVDQSWVAELDALGYEGQKLLDGARTLIKQQTK